MSLIVEFELETPILRTAASAIETLRIDELYRTEAGEPKLLFWAMGEEFTAFERALRADDSIARFAELESLAERRLYSVVLSEEATTKLTYPVAAEHDIGILDIVVTETTVVRARVPSRKALRAYREGCLERDVGFLVRRIYQEHRTETAQYDLTAHQREALLTALERGYFEVPRTVTLSELAAELDISDQALSARLRRGQTNLLWNTLADDSS
ncbi:helix-turn-helix domain-containing protein [Natrialba asiatica]|uniref:Bacterio-opsin activator HTH domain-containing protein n=1 Tax=Natrialba asiatica (strain ATCC 700177 / DSM 12278 / JCM 9576 / FERM P-10747 / NBRC 102637 / 172P1) TaxID=29540 RepID=M0AV16_NATA1|nr:helix-turn-helix domain-containing protein [Natrialba asiatica]ELZ02526.1 bacterio-opsin activator HTH domain-containing protein [Natrialba asiatica DSM 12278]